MAFDQGGGGGKAGGPTGTIYALDRPYDLTWPPTPEQWAQLNEMLDLLFKNNTHAAADISTANDTIDNLGSGDVVGPSSAVDGDVVLYDGVTGKLIRDSGMLGSNLVTGPASVTADNNVAVYNGTSGKVLKDGGATFSALLANSSVAVLDVPKATINAGSTTVGVIPAPGAGYMIRVLALTAEKNISVVFASSPNFRLSYTGDGTIIGTITPTLTSTSYQVTMAAAITTVAISASFHPNNVGLDITLSASSANGSSGLRLIINYLIVPVLA